MKNAGIWSGIIVFFLGCFFFWKSLGLTYASAVGPGPGLFPLWLSGILMFIALLYIWESGTKDVILLSDILPKGRELRNVIAILVSLLVFLIIVNFTGFIIAGTILMSMLLLREYKWYWGLAISFITTLSTFVLFQILLDVPLPVNIFGW